MPLSGGVSRTLVHAPGNGLFPFAWTRDSRRLIYGRRDTSRNEAGSPRGAGERPHSTVWMVSIDGGDARQVNLPSSFDVHPDGRRITYLTSDEQIELWALDRLSSSMTTPK